MRLAFLATLLTFAAGAQTVSDDVTAYLRERRAELKAQQELRGAADELMRKGSYSAAEISYRQLGDREDLAVALLAQGRFEEAMGPAPYQLDHLNYLATFIGRLGREDLAVRVYKRALDVGGNQAEIYHALGDFYGGRAEWDLALPQFRKAHELDPENRTSAFALAEALLASGRQSEADAEYRTILSVDPNDSAGLTKEARVIFVRNLSKPALQGGRRADDLVLALNCIQRARGLSPDDPEISDLYGQIVLQMGLPC
jgi:tetratricopeptide (TPR) repeat protein